MIDWESILAAFSGSVGIFAIFGFVFKRIIEKAIDAKFKHYEEKNKLLISEITRRDGKRYDYQFETLRELSELVYRARNLCRDISKDIDKMFQDDAPEAVDLSRISPINDFRETYKLLRDLLYRSGPFLPENITEHVHSGGHFLPLLKVIEEIENMALPISKEKTNHVSTTVNTLYEKIDKDYIGLSNAIKDFLTVNSMAVS
jgi:hypothetical protein